MSLTAGYGFQETESFVHSLKRGSADQNWESELAVLWIFKIKITPFFHLTSNIGKYHLETFGLLLIIVSGWIY